MPSLTQVQRFLTVQFITKHRLDVPTIWLKSEAATPSAEDAVREPEKLNCNLNEWLDTDRNLGARLVDGYIEVKIKSPDDIWAHGLFAACRALQVDARAAYGTRMVSSILFKVNDAVDAWTERWPRGHRDQNGAWVETKFVYSQLPTPRAKALWHDSAPLPGSRFGGDLVVWRPNGKPAADIAELGLEDLEFSRPLAATNIPEIIRAIAFATLSYWIQVYLDGLEKWDESLINTIGGWIARLVREGRDINARGKSLESVCWSPIDSEETARDLIRFLGVGRELLTAFERAASALERNSDTPIPGWGAIETRFGVQAKVGIRRAFRAGLDIDVIERMSDQYIYDRTSDDYLDRDELLKGLRYEHKHDAMVARHKPESFWVGKKKLNPFDLYSGSSLRTDVQHREFRPGYEPGAILRHSPVHGLLNGEREADEYRLLNTFPGFFVKPIAVVDKTIMGRVVTTLDRMLGLLTQDNDAQMLWLKKFVAWIAKHPEIKPQVCPIIVGGQGIGKSLFGDNLMRALFGSMAGAADAASLSDNKFLITPFVGKLITFIDEVRLESVAAINIIKKLVRADLVSGQMKFGHQKDWYIPSRLLIASNRPDIGLTPADAADRAFFFIMSWTAENKHMTDREFSDWAIELKPFYSEVVASLESVVFRQHLMRYFMDIEVERAELEDLKHSSRNDENVIRSTMSKPREIARAIVADARVLQGLDITAWFTTLQLRDAIKRWDDSRVKVEASQVMMEFERAGVLEVIRGDLRRFKYGYGKLLQKMGEAHGLPITQHWDWKPGDFNDNDVQSQSGAPEWRGNKQGRQQQDTRRRYDPDYLPQED
jgi:hypothetical protein